MEGPSSDVTMSEGASLDKPAWTSQLETHNHNNTVLLFEKW